jgi:hypothetical protein
MNRTIKDERLNKLFSSLQEIVYDTCRGLNVKDEFFLENPIKLHSSLANKDVLAYAILDVYKKGFLSMFNGAYYGRIILFEGGVVEGETKNKNFSSYVQKITDEYMKKTHSVAVYYYHH